MRTLTLERYSKLFVGRKGISVLRALQYEELAEIKSMGLVLDFGGGSKADYRPLVACSEYESINIDPEISPTWLVKVGEPLPIVEKRYDTVLSMNTFEHIFDVRPIIDQLFLSLKPGGQLVAMVPFLFPVHGHPDDYFRPTSSWWTAALSSAGFRDTKVEPLFWGRAATGITASGMSGPLQRLRLHMALLKDMIASKIKQPSRQLAMSRAVGYFVRAQRPDDGTRDN